MGRNNIKRGNNVFLCITIIILLLTFSCSSVNGLYRRQYTNNIFLLSEKHLAEKDFDGAIRENRKVLSLFVKGPPGDQALFNIAMIYVHYDNPHRDYSKALELLRQLIQEYPHSQLLEQSKNWESVLVISSPVQLNIKGETAKLPSSDASSRVNFNEALEANNNILSLPDDSLQKDKALYSIALIYAHFDNPDRSYQKTMQYFARLIKEYPQSQYSEEAKVWMSVLKIIEQAKQVDIDIEKKKKEMGR